MAKTFTIDPLTRIEGHLKIEVTVDSVNNVQQVIDAKCQGMMFRGFEQILVGHDPLDAPHLTQRICGVCPVSHGMASSTGLENAAKVIPPANGRILRNLVLGANFVQSHILHFYHLAMLDYLNTTGLLDMDPWLPRFITPDMIGGADAQTLATHYLKALEIRRKAHQMGAIFGGKLPCAPTFLPGGCTDKVDAAKIKAYRTLLTEIRGFIDTVMLPDLQMVSSYFPQYYQIGKGCGKLLAFGVFDLNDAGTTKLLKRGIYDGAAVRALDIKSITEDVLYSWYSSPTRLNPSAGQTVQNANKTTAYSWIKAPRYADGVYEVGPLARMWMSGAYTRGISVMDRLVARVWEANIVADSLDAWLNELAVGKSAYSFPKMPAAAGGIGLTEAPRGALGHWLTIAAGKIKQYQILTPTAWNASPRDDKKRKGAIEQALIGTPVVSTEVPVEVLRVVHSFDPCLSCAVHMLRPGQKTGTIIPVPAAG
jgi:hydrogenase large subunit